MTAILCFFLEDVQISVPKSQIGHLKAFHFLFSFSCRFMIFWLLFFIVFSVVFGGSGGKIHMFKVMCLFVYLFIFKLIRLKRSPSI